jgi:hypothetical protein
MFIDATQLKERFGQAKTTLLPAYAQQTPTSLSIYMIVSWNKLSLRLT